MGIKALLRLILKQKTTYFPVALLAGVALICGVAAANADDYMMTFNRTILHFLLQYPLLLLLLIPLLPILQSEMLQVRQKSRDGIFLTEAAAALVLSLIYALSKTCVEYAFYAALGGTLSPKMMLTSFGLLLLTAWSLLLFFLALKALLGGGVWAVLLLTAVLGVDTLAAIVYVPWLPHSLLLLAMPLAAHLTYVIEDPANWLLLFGVSFLKIALGLMLLRQGVRRREFV